MRRKQHWDVRYGEIGKDIDFRGQKLSQKTQENVFLKSREAGGI